VFPRISSPRGRRLIVGGFAVVAFAGLMSLDSLSARAQTPADHPVYLPGALKAASFPHVRSVTATATDLATPVPTSTGPTPTRTPPPTDTPTPRPTTIGGHVGHAEGQEIVLQVGFTDTDEAGEVWEEMNGTPWFTLYGDGRVIAQHELGDLEKKLYEGQVDEDMIQAWLQEMVYGAHIYEIPDDANLYHPAGIGKPILYVYVATTGGGGARMTIPGYRDWERHPVTDHPYNDPIQRALTMVEDMQTWAKEQATAPYESDSYTLIVQWAHPERLPNAPSWDGPPVRHIAEAAPTAQSNYVDHVPGHKFVSGDDGRELEALVRPAWLQSWGIYNLAAEFTIGGRNYDIGLRQEVPGGSPFLSDVRRRDWYRRDVGWFPGAPSALPPADPRRLPRGQPLFRTL
jgi:hypothetical protein